MPKFEAIVNFLRNPVQVTACCVIGMDVSIWLILLNWALFTGFGMGSWTGSNPTARYSQHPLHALTPGENPLAGDGFRFQELAAVVVAFLTVGFDIVLVVGVNKGSQKLTSLWIILYSVLTVQFLNLVLDLLLYVEESAGTILGYCLFPLLYIASRIGCVLIVTKDLFKNKSIQNPGNTVAGSNP